MLIIKIRINCWATSRSAKMDTQFNAVWDFLREEKSEISNEMNFVFLVLFLVL